MLKPEHKTKPEQTTVQTKTRQIHGNAITDRGMQARQDSTNLDNGPTPKQSRCTEILSN